MPIVAIPRSAVKENTLVDAGDWIRDRHQCTCVAVLLLLCLSMFQSDETISTHERSSDSISSCSRADVICHRHEQGKAVFVRKMTHALLVELVC